MGKRKQSVSEQRDYGWETDDETPLEEYPKTGMTGWYDPTKLAGTAADIITSSLLGVRGDFRVLEALTAKQETFDYRWQGDPKLEQPRRELWLDYVSDVGDGWNPTYAVAQLLGRPQLVTRAPDGSEVTTQRGAVLVMGGDEVYPSASREGYQTNLVRPYRAALRLAPDDEPPHVFAIPGNHDWYDGLVAFTRMFCQQRWIGAWQTRQSRSYFALRLPHGWWLFGTDFQLESDIDKPQLEYFSSVARDQMKPGDRLVMCTAEPVWVNSRTRHDPMMQTHLNFFESRLRRANPGIHLVARIAGDLHHYRRHESANGEQCITAGGGGAFLHPTHGEPVPIVEAGTLEDEQQYTLKAAFPPEKVSRKMTRWNFFFQERNGWFGVVTAAAYGLLSLAFTRPGPSSLFWICAILFVFVTFTDTHKKWYKWVGGLSHGALHVTAAIGCANGALELLKLFFGVPELQLDTWTGLGQELLVMAFAAFGGFVFGPFLMGLYLWFSLNVLRRHANEAFSALRIQNYKNFLRLHVTADQLTIYPIGLVKVPRKWRAVPDAPAGKPLFEAVDRPLEPVLIEPPIIIPAHPAAAPAK